MSASAVLGFDVGGRRIGVAVGNTLSGTAREAGVVAVREGGIDWSHFDRLVREWRPDLLVVGDPLPMDPAGGEQESRRRAHAFARAASERSGLPHVMADERLSSKEAAARFAEQRRHGGRRRRDAETLDALAAVIIVERWLQYAHHD